MDTQLEQLEKNVTQLVELCIRLQDQNKQLIAECDLYRSERARMFSKNRDISREIDAIIDELYEILDS